VCSAGRRPSSACPDSAVRADRPDPRTGAVLTTIPTPPTVPAARVVRARTAVAVVFVANGMIMATLWSRLPGIRAALGLDPARLGLLLGAGAVGAVSGLPLAGVVVHRLGPSRTVRIAALGCGVGLAWAGIAPSEITLLPALFGLGLLSGIWDVAMNVEGAAVEQLLGRPVMPRFHAGFSLGTVVGALGGAAAAGLHLPVRVHLPVVAVLGALCAAAATRAFLPVPEPPPEEGIRAAAPDADGAGLAGAWRERRTLLVGLLVVTMALAEGSANDWLAVGLVDGYRAPEALAAGGYALFVAAMTLGRLQGGRALERWGRVVTLRVSALLVFAGIPLVAAGAAALGSHSLAAAPPAILALAAGAGVAGVLVWGLGSSLGFPVGMSAAADEPARAPARVSVVSTIGYLAFLAGPPVLGALGNRVGVLPALLVVCVVALLGVLAAGAARPLPGSTAEGTGRRGPAERGAASAGGPFDPAA
jgi:hypothetical protein